MKAPLITAMIPPIQPPTNRLCRAPRLSTAKPICNNVDESTPDAAPSGRSLSGQRRTVESLLGRPVMDDESVSIKVIQTSILRLQLSPGERKEALEWLQRYFAKVDAGRKAVSDAEEEEIISEALRSTRPGYRPAN